jgi:hypothetical protein
VESVDRKWEAAAAILWEMNGGGQETFVSAFILFGLK